MENKSVNIYLKNPSRKISLGNDPPNLFSRYYKNFVIDSNKELKNDVIANKRHHFFRVLCHGLGRKVTTQRFINFYRKHSRRS